MSSFKETAQEYIPKQTLNIVDLDKVDLSLPIEDRIGKDLEGKEFSYKVLVANEQEYRVPNSVLEEVKKILELKPDVKFIRAVKQGSGLNTRYSVKVIP